MKRITKCVKAASKDGGSGKDDAGTPLTNRTGAESAESRTTKAQAHNQDAADADDKSGKTLRVLVVEDNIDQANSLAELLGMWGHEVGVANDGLAGVARARSLHPDVVIMDIGLPEIDGYQAARWLRADPATCRIYLIALTGYGEDEDRREAFAAGFDLHLTKPANLDELWRALNMRGNQ